MSLLARRPRFPIPAAIALLRDRYGLDADVTALPSERDQNFLVRTAPDTRFVLKIANATDAPALLEAQAAALHHLAPAGLCPRVIPTAAGGMVDEATSPDGLVHRFRLVSYLEGMPLSAIGRRSRQLFEDLGRQLGSLDGHLATFDHPALHREFHWDLARAMPVIAAHTPAIADRALQALIAALAPRIDRTIAGLRPRLRRGVIHNDANDDNVLMDRGPDLGRRYQRVRGFIDFGDMLHTWVVCEPAVAAAYAMLDHPDPLVAAAAVVCGYHARYRLAEEELASLFPLALLRLCLSACIAADQQRQQPDNTYLSVSQAAIRRSLPSLAAIPWSFAEATLRAACGLAPSVASRRVIEWLGSRTHACGPPLQPDPRRGTGLVLDLGLDSPLVSGDPGQNVEATLTARIALEMTKAGAELGIGRYGETRYLYTSPRFGPPARPPGSPQAGEPLDPALREHRTVHLGIDLFAPAGTTVLAPLSGVVHARANHGEPLDYGGVVILEHRTDAGSPFFTLYGHLSAASPDALRPGQTIARGEPIGRLGTPEDNGGWTPHLHFQVMTDLLGLETRFPGVCRASQWEVWHAFSPDPNLILGIPPACFPDPAPQKGATLAARRALLGPNLGLAYDEPLKIVRGWMQFLFDETGRRFLDAYNNVPHVGHCHPRVVRAGQAQMAVLNTNTRYLHDLIHRYAERLTATLPDPLRVCVFVNSASEANELALRLARAHTGQRDVIVLEAAYHGHTTGLIDISPFKHAGPGGAGPPDWVHAAPLPDLYRGKYRAGDVDAGRKYARDVARIVDRLAADGRQPAAFIAETCPSVGGQILLPQGYLLEVYRTVRRAGGVCIADEVQTGYGRMGTHFWAFQAHAVVPDILVLGKPIGNGHPLGAVVTTREIAASFDNGMEFFSTFGGNPVSCAIGLAVLDVVLDEHLQAHALEVGSALLDGLRSLGSRFAIVGDVRGSGLFLGVELVRDRDTREPAGPEAAFLVNRMRELGVLVGTDGPHHNVIKIRPPMPFTRHDATTLVATLGAVLEDDFERSGH